MKFGVHSSGKPEEGTRQISYDTGGLPNVRTLISHDKVWYCFLTPFVAGMERPIWGIHCER